MKVTPGRLEGLYLLEPAVFSDARGYFFESFHLEKFCDVVGETIQFVQDNESRSQKGVLRGLHYQTSSTAQGKLVRVTEGEVFDVAVDLRRQSPTFGQWMGVHLSATNKCQFWIPAGFAHGFLVLSDSAIFQYKVTNYWSREDERCIRFDDPQLGIEWPMSSDLIQVSEKDKLGVAFQDASHF